MKNSGQDQRLYIGIFILIIGVILLIDKLNIFETRDIIQFWPAILIFVGGLKLSRAQTTMDSVIGVALVSFGVVSILNRLGITNIRMREWWPVLVILLGFLIIFKDKTKANFNGIFSSKSETSNDTVVEVAAVMSGHQGNVATQNFQGGSLTAVMGGVELDFRNASIEKEAVLNVFAFWGGVSLIIPKDWSVVNNGIAIMGGIDDKSVPNMETNKRLIITGTAIMGGVEIKN